MFGLQAFEPLSILWCTQPRLGFLCEGEEEGSVLMPYLLTFASLLQLLLGVLPDQLEQSVAHRAALPKSLGHHQRFLHKPVEHIQDVTLLEVSSHTHRLSCLQCPPPCKDR